MSPERAVYAALDEMGIAYDVARHGAAFSMAQSAEAMASLRALPVKNYFLCPRSGKRFYLLMTRPGARLRTKDVSAQAGAPRLGFAPEDALSRILRADAGAVSPMGLLFDAEHTVTVLADEALWRAERLAFHPCAHTESLAMSSADFFDVFLKRLGYPPIPIAIHDFLDAQEG